MDRLRFYLFIGIFLITLTLNHNISAQNTTKLDFESSIKISATVEAKEVPLNRSLTFTVIVDWTGDLKRYQISELENPVVENFEIFSTSAADRRLSEGGVEKAAKIYEFVLKPKSLGMGYIESVIVKYIDNETGEGHSLITNRLNVKVIDSVPEPGSKKWLIKWIILAVVILVIFMGLWSWQRSIRERKKKESETVQVVPIEEEYLTTLHESLDLNSTELKINEAFWMISKIARKYLSQKYQIPALESTTEKIISDLSDFELDQTMLNNIQEILTVSDLAKFAGSEGNRNELDRTYTLLEAIFERNIGETKAKEQSAENK